jgi:flagellar biosynthesis component FlhA
MIRLLEIKSIIYLTASGALAILALACFYLFYLSELLKAPVFLLAAFLFGFLSYKLGKHTVDTLERIEKKKARTKKDLEREKTKRMREKEERGFKRIRGQQRLEDKRLYRRIAAIFHDFIR